MVGDHLYAACCAGKLYAFDPDDGKILWKCDMSADSAWGFHGQPLIIDSVIYIGTDQSQRGRHGDLHAIDRYTGKLLWKLPADPGIPGDLCVKDSLLFMVSYGGEVLAVNRFAGDFVWRIKGESRSDTLARDTASTKFARATVAPVAWNDYIYVSAPDTAVICLQAATGTVVWSKKLDAPMSSRFILLDSMLAFGTDARDMRYIRCRDGAEIRRDSLAVRPFLAMAYVDSVLVFMGDTGNEKPRDLIALNPYNGTTIWQNSLDDPDSNACWNVPRVHVWGDYVLLGTNTGWVAAFSAADGSLIWSRQLQGSIRSIGHSSGMLYVGTMAGRLYAIKADFSP